MKNTKLYLLIGLLAISPLSANASSLLDIYQLALKNDSQLKADRAAYEAGLENRYLGRAALLPQINAAANYTDNRTDVTGAADPTLPGNRTGEINRTQTGWGLSLEQPLFDM